MVTKTDLLLQSIRILESRRLSPLIFRQRITIVARVGTRRTSETNIDRACSRLDPPAGSRTETKANCDQHSTHMVVGRQIHNLNRCSFPDAPRCKETQRRVYGVSLHETTSIRCDLDADPESEIEYTWAFNNSQGKRADLNPVTASAHRTSRYAYLGAEARVRASLILHHYLRQKITR